MFSVNRSDEVVITFLSLLLYIINGGCKVHNMLQYQVNRALCHASPGISSNGGCLQNIVTSNCLEFGSFATTCCLMAHNRVPWVKIESDAHFSCKSPVNTLGMATPRRQRFGAGNPNLLCSVVGVTAD